MPAERTAIVMPVWTQSENGNQTNENIIAKIYVNFILMENLNGS